MVKITKTNAKKLAKELDIDLKVLPIKSWIYALKVELEHGTRTPKTDVTHDDLTMTAKIALAHILEFPDYYFRLKDMEDQADEYWKDKTKPEIIKTSNH